MTKELKPFYIGPNVITDEDVEEICQVVVSLGGRICEDKTYRNDWKFFGVDDNLETVWYNQTGHYGNATPLKSMEEFREMFCEPVEEKPMEVVPPLTFTEIMQQYINLYDQMPTEEDKQYIAQKMEELCGKYTGEVGWIQLDMSNIKQVNEED